LVHNKQIPDILDKLPKGLFSPQASDSFARLVSEFQTGIEIRKLETERHPNGFQKLVLFEAQQTGERIRQHRWDDPTDVASEDEAVRPHGHAWDFVSYILSGSLSVTSYEECLTGSGTAYSKYGYKPKTSSASHKLEYQGKCALRKIEHRFHSAGSIYVCRKSEVHTVCVAEPDTMSLILATPHSVDSVPVYSKVECASGLIF
jgi:hypothetical protein